MMNNSIQKIILLSALGLAFVNLATPALAGQMSMQATTRRAIETAPQDFVAIRGEARSDDDSYHVTPDFLALYTAGSPPSGGNPAVMIEHFKPDEKNGDWWRVRCEYVIDWSRDQVVTQTQAVLGPAIPQDFVYQGSVNDKYGLGEPDDFEMNWVGPNNISIEVDSSILDGKRFLAILISHKLPK
jgi:hypothetical protein